MSGDFSQLTEPERRQLDAQLDPRAGSWWDNFYADRAKPCPFFVPHPDESLVEFVEEGLVKPGRAIDIGCGNGRNAIFLARHGFSVEGIDYSETAIEWARERAAQAGVVVSFTSASIFETALTAGNYDFVYDSGCFHHMPPHRRTQYVELIVRALRRGGWLGLTCFRPEGGSGYTDAEVYERRSLGGGLGYTEERLREIWSGASSIHRLRRMIPQRGTTERFGEDFLWAMLAQKA